jgi:ATP/maltotriose-dependent transcriptional regulator MalT
MSPECGAVVLEARAAADGQPGNAERAVISQLVRLPASATLILADFHLTTSPDTLEFFRFLLDHLPPVVSMVVAARSDPPLPLSQLRAGGKVTEIRAAPLHTWLA